MTITPVEVFVTSFIRKLWPCDVLGNTFTACQIIGVSYVHVFSHRAASNSINVLLWPH